MVRAAWRAISKPGSLRGIYFKIDEFFHDVFQQVLARLGTELFESNSIADGVDGAASVVFQA